MENGMVNDVKGSILGIASDLMTNFLYYDRKDCDLLKVGEIETAILAGEVTIDEIVAVFKYEIETSVLQQA